MESLFCFVWERYIVRERKREKERGPKSTGRNVLMYVVFSLNMRNAHHYISFDLSRLEDWKKKKKYIKSSFLFIFHVIIMKFFSTIFRLKRMEISLETTFTLSFLNAGDLETLRGRYITSWAREALSFSATLLFVFKWRALSLVKHVNVETGWWTYKRTLLYL